jgi:hypothetical protein
VRSLSQTRLDGETVDMPKATGVNVTFKTAPKASGPQPPPKPAKKRTPVKKTAQHDLL